MEWDECCEKKIIKPIHPDINRAISQRKIAQSKIASSRILTDNDYYAKISLLYESLRELLECLALEKGYGISNHECYKAFISRVLGLNHEAHIFDRLRKARNGINYYGEEMDWEKARVILDDLKYMIKVIEKA
jgi:hypothetical protein